MVPFLALQMDWLGALANSRFGLVALGVSLAAVGFTVYRTVSGSGSSGDSGSSGNPGNADGTASSNRNTQLSPEIVRTPSSDSRSSGGRNSRGNTPVLSSARSPHMTAQQVPALSLDDSDGVVVEEADAVVTLPRVVEEHEHHALAVIAPTQGMDTNRQLVWLILMFMVLAFLGHVFQLNSTSSSVLSSLGFTAAGVLSVLVSPGTFGMASGSSNGVPGANIDIFRTPAKPAPIAANKPQSNKSHAAASKKHHTHRKMVQFPIVHDHSAPLPRLPHSPEGRAPRSVVSGGASSGIVDDSASSVPVTPVASNESLQQADALAEQKKVDDSDAILKQELHRMTTNKDRAAVLWRLAKNQFIRASQAVKANTGTPESRTAMYRHALEHAQACLTADEHSSQGHKWASILIAYVANSTKEMIENAYRIRDHARRAVELDPDDATAQHILGEWAYNVANISWLNRKLAATLFASPPTATLDEALVHFLRSEELSPGGYRANLVRIVETLLALKRTSEAREWAVKLMASPPTPDDSDKLPARVEDIRKKLGFSAATASRRLCSSVGDKLLSKPTWSLKDLTQGLADRAVTLSDADVVKIARMAHLAVQPGSPEFVQSKKDMEATLSYVHNVKRALEAADAAQTSSPSSTSVDVPSSLSRLRTDTVTEGNIEEELLQNARAREGQYFAVPKFAGSST